MNFCLVARQKFIYMSFRFSKVIGQDFEVYSSDFVSDDNKSSYYKFACYLKYI